MKSAFIADDSPLARGAVVRAVSSVGIPVIEACSAALDPELDVSTLACALLDMDLGDGTGPELATELRRREPKLPIAFFTAGATADQMSRAAAIGPIFLKPADLERAITWIHQKTMPVRRVTYA